MLITGSAGELLQAQAGQVPTVPEWSIGGPDPHCARMVHAGKNPYAYHRICRGNFGSNICLRVLDFEREGRIMSLPLNVVLGISFVYTLLFLNSLAAMAIQ
jgi:hypothetical protein